jgi:phage terminase small subunit
VKPVKAKKPAAKKVPAKKAAPARKKAPARAKAPRKSMAAQNAGSAEQRRKLFIEAFLSNGENVTQAAVAAGFSPKTAASQGSRLLRAVKVQQELDSRRGEALAKVQKDTGITLERTLREIARGAFFDVRKLFNADGTPKSIQELDDETASVLAGLDVQQIGADDGAVSMVKKYKLADRKGYLDMLMKHLGGYKKDNEQGAEASANAIATLLAGMGKSTLPVTARPEVDPE